MNTTTKKTTIQKVISPLVMRVIDTETVGRKNKTTLRKFFKSNYDLKTFNDLMAFVIAFGVDVGVRKKTQEKRTFQYLAEIYNDDVKASQKKQRQIKKEIKKQLKKIKKQPIGEYVNIVIEFIGYEAQAKLYHKDDPFTFGDGDVREEFELKYNPLEKNKGGKFDEEELEQIKKSNEDNPVSSFTVNMNNAINDLDDVKKIPKVKSNKVKKINEFTKINVYGYELEEITREEYYLHSKKPVVDVNKWINEKLDKVLVFGFRASPHDWCKVKLIRKTLLTVKKPVNPRSLPIKQAGSLDLDHHALKNDVWDKKRDMCVVDYIIWKYGRRDGFIKKLKTSKGTQQEQDEAVEFYSTHFYNMGNEWERNAFTDNNDVYDLIDNKNITPNKNGYTIDNIEQFCENFKINMICLIDGNIKYHYYNEIKSKQHPAFVFEMKNNHLYPICDTKTVEKYTKQIKNIKSNTIQTGTIKEVEEQKTPLIENMFKDYTIPHKTKIEYAIEIMERENTQTNYPTDLKLTNNILNNFVLNNKRYLFNDENDELSKSIMKYCEDTGVEYVGQSPQSFTYDHIKEVNDNHISYFNNDVRKALCCQEVKDRTHRGICVGKKEFANLYDEAECFDMNKQYRYAMENPLEEFITIGFTDIIEEVSNEFIENDVALGLYYVYTDDNQLFFGNNFYSSATIREAKKLKIKFEISHFIKGKPIDDLKIFQDIIDVIKIEYAKYPRLMKMIINSIYGMMAKTKHKTTILKVDTDINRVYEKYAVENGKKNKKIFVDKIISKSGKEYFAYGDKNESELLNHNLPIAIQIQDFANIYFNRMIDDIGGKLIWRKTDCAMIHNPQNINVCKEVGGYDYHTKPVRENLKMDYKRDYTYLQPQYDWNMMEENDSDDWEKIIENIKKNGGGMVSGRAGTGKSFVAINGIKHLDEKYGMKTKPLAFTNKATIQLKGSTIDSFLRIDKDGKINKKWALKIAQHIDLIGLDEMSMVGQHRWRLLCELKMLTGIAFMLLGDDRQLPPVEDDGKELDEEMFLNDEDILDDMKDKNLTVDDLINGTNITYLNKTRQVINSIVQNHIRPEDALLIPYKIPITKDGKKNKDGLKYHQDAYIFEGAKLIMWITTKCKTFKKNESVFIIEIKGDGIDVSNGDTVMWFDLEDFHKTFLLGYASTVHKSQGDTCDGMVNIFDTQFMMSYLSNNNGGVDWFNHPVIYELCGGLKCELTKMKRYDQKLWDKLEEICESDMGGKKAIYTAISRARSFNNVKIRNINNCPAYCHYKKPHHNYLGEYDL